MQYFHNKYVLNLFTLFLTQDMVNAKCLIVNVNNQYSVYRFYIYTINCNLVNKT